MFKCSDCGLESLFPLIDDECPEHLLVPKYEHIQSIQKLGRILRGEEIGFDGVFKKEDRHINGFKYLKDLIRTDRNEAEKIGQSIRFHLGAYMHWCGISPKTLGLAARVLEGDESITSI